MNLVKRLAAHKIVRYIFIGGLSYLIELSLLIGLRYGIGLEQTASVGISFWFAFAVSFVLQKFFAFKSTTLTAKRIVKQTLFYSTLVFVNFGFTLLFVHLFTPLVGLIIARTTALIITTGWNFILYSRVIFKEPSSTPKQP